MKEKQDNQPTLTPPNEWVSVYDRLPEPGERVLATDCGFVGEFYINKRGKWQRYNVNCSELLMALDILYWMPLPAPPDKDNNVPAKTPNEPLTLEVLAKSQLLQMLGEKVEVIRMGEMCQAEWATVRSFGDCKTDSGCSCCHELYGKTWIAYRLPPEGEEEI